MKITKIYNDAKDKNVAKTVLFYASNDESKTLYYEPSLENEVSKEDLVDFFLKGLVIQAVENGECVGEYSMPTTLGEEQSGGSVEPVILYASFSLNLNSGDYDRYLYTADIDSEDMSNLSREEKLNFLVSSESLFDLFIKNYRILVCYDNGEAEEENPWCELNNAFKEKNNDVYTFKAATRDVKCKEDFYAKYN